MYNEFYARISCVIIFIGFNLAFLPQFVMGSQGMPRRYFNYIDQFQPFHQLSTIGAYTMAVGFLIMAGYMIHSLLRGKPAPANPWGSRAMEWQTSSPAPHHNFEHIPVIINGPYDYHKPMSEFQLGIAHSTNGHHSHEKVDVNVESAKEKHK